MTDWSEPRELQQAIERIERTCQRILAGNYPRSSNEEVIVLLWGIASAASNAITIDMSHAGAVFLLEVVQKALTRIKVFTGDDQDLTRLPFQPDHDVQMIYLLVRQVPLLEISEAPARAAHREENQSALAELDRFEDQATTDFQTRLVRVKEEAMFADAMMAGSAQRECRNVALRNTRETRERLEILDYEVRKLPDPPE